jgi:uncharacterized membrane protein
MSFMIFNIVGLNFIIRFLHVAAAMIWIGSIFCDSKKQKHVATVTIITGMILAGLYYQLSFFSNWGINWQIGAGLALMMWINTFFDRPNSRFANLMLAVPTLFFMESASHLPVEVNAEANRFIPAISLAVVILGVEGYILGVKAKHIDSMKKALVAGGILLVALYLTFELTTK